MQRMAVRKGPRAISVTVALGSKRAALTKATLRALKFDRIVVLLEPTRLTSLRACVHGLGRREKA